ncbi:MAG: hypothetical protein LQ345_004000 [Seirophora villosa]|nr:MAG: hypothetical protein LQ345_004000 [Seirophora villosa]
MDDSSDDRHPRRIRAADEKGNPFVTFSRLVDQQLSSFYRTFTRPSSFSPSRSDCGDSDEHQRRRRDANAEAEQVERSLDELFAPRRQCQSHKSVTWKNTFADQEERPGRDKETTHRLQEALTFWNQQKPQDLIREGGEDLQKKYEEAEHVMDCIRSRICQLFPLREDTHESSDPDSRCPYQPVDENLDKKVRGSLIEPFLPTLEWAFPKSCSSRRVTESLYSPTKLENDDCFREHHGKWRRAFDDRLLLSYGKNVSEDTSNEAQSNKWEWADSLAKRNFIGYDPSGMRMVPIDDPKEFATPTPVNDAGEDASTEIELYKRFLGSQSPRITTNTSVEKSARNSDSQTASDQPSLISTLTTTERKTLQDGSVYTQVVLRKRFSDGREECTETEHTAHGTQRFATITKQLPQPAKEITSASTPLLGHDGKIKQALGQRIEEQKKRGWFWS